MRKELADRGLRVSAAWSRVEMTRELYRLATRAERRDGSLAREKTARQKRAEKDRAEVSLFSGLLGA
jgi:hypothetical protein